MEQYKADNTRAIKLSLWFDRGEKPELQKTLFKHPYLPEPVLAVRGKTPGAYSQKSGSFQWTPAVKALSVFFLRSAARTLSGDTFASPLLKGGAGTPAASLDYALGKQTNWLMDMFGFDKSGNTLARAIIKRTNPERKRAGPVSLSISEQLIQADAVEIFLGDERIEDPFLLFALAESICERWSRQGQDSAETKSAGFESYKVLDVESLAYLKNGLGLKLKRFLENQALSGHRHPPFNQKEWRRWFFKKLRREIEDVLSFTDIFSLENSTALLNSITSAPYFAGICGIKKLPLIELELNFTAANRSGIADNPKSCADVLHKSGEIACLVPPSMAGAAALFEHLRFFKGYSVFPNYKFAHTVEILSRIVDESFTNPPAACVLSSATAATLLTRETKPQYQPLMLLPFVSHRVVAPRSENGKKPSLSTGLYGFLTETPGTASMYFDALVKRGLIRREDVNFRHIEADSVISFLNDRESNPRAIQAFPSYEFNAALNDCSFIDEEENSSRYQGALLFVHRNLLKDTSLAKALDVELRDSWLTLKEDRRLLDLIVRVMLENRDYLKCIARFCGLHNIAPERFYAQTGDQPFI